MCLSALLVSPFCELPIRVIYLFIWCVSYICLDVQMFPVSDINLSWTAYLGNVSSAGPRSVKWSVDAFIKQKFLCFEVKSICMSMIYILLTSLRNPLPDAWLAQWVELATLGLGVL